MTHSPRSKRTPGQRAQSSCPPASPPRDPASVVLLLLLMFIQGQLLPQGLYSSTSIPRATRTENKGHDSPGMVQSLGATFSPHVDMRIPRTGLNKGSTGSCSMDNPFDVASTTTGGHLPASSWSHDLSSPLPGECPDLTQIFDRLGGSLADEPQSLGPVSMLGCRNEFGSNPNLQLTASSRPSRRTYKYGVKPAAKPVHSSTSNGYFVSSRKQNSAHHLVHHHQAHTPPSSSCTMSSYESWSHRRASVENYGVHPHRHSPQVMAEQSTLYTVPPTSSPYSELSVGQRRLITPPPPSSRPQTQHHILPSQHYEMSPDTSWNSPPIDPPPPYPYSEIPPYDNPVWLGESMGSNRGMPIHCQDVYQSLMAHDSYLHDGVESPGPKGYGNGIAMHIGAPPEMAPILDKSVPSYPPNRRVYNPLPPTPLPSHSQPTPSHNPSSSTSDISRESSTVLGSQSPRLKVESPSQKRLHSIRKQPTSGGSSGVKKGKATRGRTGSRSAKGANDGFCVQFGPNFTLADGGDIMKGVAPSGSGKSKVRKTEQAIKAAEIAGGDERVRDALRVALR